MRQARGRGEREYTGLYNRKYLLDSSVYHVRKTVVEVVICFEQSI